MIRQTEHLVRLYCVPFSIFVNQLCCVALNLRLVEHLLGSFRTSNSSVVSGLLSPQRIRYLSVKLPCGHAAPKISIGLAILTALELVAAEATPHTYVTSQKPRSSRNTSPIGKQDMEAAAASCPLPCCHPPRTSRSSVNRYVISTPISPNFSD